MEKENNLSQQDIVGLHLGSCFTSLSNSWSGSDILREGMAAPTSLPPAESKGHFTAPADITDDSSEVTSLLPALLDEGHEM